MNVTPEDFRSDHFAAEMGIEYLEVCLGYARTGLTFAPRHCNSLGILHGGGALFTLAATAMFAAANAHGREAVGTNLSLTCLRPTEAGRLTAEAEEIARSRRLSTCTVHVTDEAGRLVAVLQGTAYLKDAPFPPE